MGRPHDTVRKAPSRAAGTTPCEVVLSLSPDLDIYESSVSEDGKRGAVFEVTDGTSYFYPCNILPEKLDIQRLIRVKAELDEDTLVKIDWRRDEWLVVLIIDGEPAAA